MNMKASIATFKGEKGQDDAIHFVNIDPKKHPLQLCGKKPTVSVWHSQVCKDPRCLESHAIWTEVDWNDIPDENVKRTLVTDRVQSAQEHYSTCKELDGIELRRQQYRQKEATEEIAKLKENMRYNKNQLKSIETKSAKLMEQLNK
jgi:hypothetical protein